MQPTRTTPLRSVDFEGNQQTFWVEVMRIATRGMDHPASLTENEIRRICQVAIAAMPKRAVMAEWAVAERHEVVR